MKKHLFATLLAILFLSACTTAPSAPNPSIEPTPSPKIEVQENQKITGSFSDLLSQGTKQCTYEYTDQNVTSKGKVYLHDGKIFGETNASVENDSYTANILLVDNQLYSWDPATKQGVKMDYNKLKDFAKSLPSASTQAQNNNLPDLDQQYNYDCQNWSADNAKFNVPTDVNFVDLAAQTEQLQKLQNLRPSSMPANACNVCDQLSGDQKNECRKALSC